MPTEHNANTRFVRVDKYQTERSGCSEIYFILSLDRDIRTHKTIQYIF